MLSQLSETVTHMPERRQWNADWIDVVWLLFLAALALLPPINEIHKQVILCVRRIPILRERLGYATSQARPIYSVLIKIALATLLLDHTGEVAINSRYYSIYYLPVVTAAIYFGPLATLFWTALASLAYCSYPDSGALRNMRLPPEGVLRSGDSNVSSFSLSPFS